MASRGVGARGRTEKGERFARAGAAGEREGRFALRFDLGEVTLAVFVPPDRRAVFAVVSGEKVSARSQVREPFVPKFVRFSHTSGPVATNEQPRAVLRQLRIVPALRLDAHRGSDDGRDNVRRITSPLPL